jgi:hypothetical protein
MTALKDNVREERERLQREIAEAQEKQREASLIGGPGLFEYAYTWWCRETEARASLAKLEVD